jgi:hypothetical protein
MASKFNWEGYRRAIQDQFTIVNKDKQEVPFVLNKAQDHFIQNLTDYNVILKARKMGFSSVLLAIGALKFIYGQNERIVSMSFDSDASTKQLERAKRFISSYERNNNLKIPMKYNSKNEMVFERQDAKTGQSYINTFRIGTARSDSFGRGDDITFLHLTEVSLAENLENLLAGVGEAVVNDAIVTLETTANGYNAFKDFWDEAVLGERGYKAFFYDPSWEYSEEYLADKRLKLKEMFDQEYPATPQKAFRNSGTPYFDRQSLIWYDEQGREPMAAGGIYV